VGTYCEITKRKYKFVYSRYETQQCDLLCYEMMQNATGFPAPYLSSSIGRSWTGWSTSGEDDWNSWDTLNVINVVSIDSNRLSKASKSNVSISVASRRLESDSKLRTVGI